MYRKSFPNKQSDADHGNWNGCQLITPKRGNYSNSLNFNEVYSLYRFTQNSGLCPLWRSCLHNKIERVAAFRDRTRPVIRHRLPVRPVPQQAGRALIQQTDRTVIQHTDRALIQQTDRAGYHSPHNRTGHIRQTAAHGQPHTI